MLENRSYRLKAKWLSPITLTLLLSLLAHLIIVFALAMPKTNIQPAETTAVIYAQLADKVVSQQVKEQSGKLTEQDSQHEQNETTESIAAPDVVEPNKEQSQQPVGSEKLVSTNAENKRKTSEQLLAEKSAEKNQELEQTEDVELIARQDSTSQQALERQAQISSDQHDQNPTYTNYHKLLTQYLTQRLAAPEGFIGTVRLKIMLAYGGVPIAVNVIESSGNHQVDEWAKRQAIAAGPYPAIPKKLGSTFNFSPTLVFKAQTPP